MKNYLILPVLTPILFSAASAHAEVTLDGTLGHAGALPGPDYQIGADVGQQHGGNLFHSFQDFNLQSHESATFSGPDNVQNIISRVTGGNSSSIDGTLRSTIPNADMYFLNPYGIMFGPNAKLDLQGGFHASTADYLRLQDGGRFEARYPNNSLLTVAPVAAFGFLTETPAAIKTQDSQLSVPNGKTFSWIGGGVEFNGSAPLSYDENGNTVTSSWLLAKSGRLNLASVASRGEVIPTPEELDLTTSTKGGLLTATNTFFSTSSEAGGGQVWIRAGQFKMTHSQIENNTVEQAAGDTHIQADNVIFEDGASIDSSTNGTGAGGSVNLKVADDLTLRGNNNNGGDSWFYTKSTGTMPQAGASGNIFIQARRVNLAEGAQISSSTFGTGQGGTIHLQVAEALTTTGLYAEGNLSGVFASSENEELANAGNAGDVIIQARQVNLSDRARISSSTWGTGQGGKVHLEVAETLTVVTKPEDTYSNLPGVYARSYNGGNSGNAGDVTIHARNINLAGGAMLSSDTYGTGQGGKVHLEVADTLASNDGKIYADSNNTDLEKAGNAGGVILRARNVNLAEGAVISSGTSGAGQGGTVHLEVSEILASKGGRIFTTSFNIYGDSDNSHLGPAGNVMIQARQVDLTEGASISSATNGPGQGGTVHLEVSETLTANNSTIYADSSNSDLENAGPAGKVIVQARQVDLTEGAQISSTTFGTGQSGTVHLQVAETLTATGVDADGYSSGVFASSENDQLENAGAAGNLQIEARQVVLTDGGKLTSGTLGTGPGGNLSLQVSGTLTVSGQAVNGKNGSVGAGSRGTMENAGQAGQLKIQANTINILNAGEISTQSENAGGGDLTIFSSNLLYLQQGQITTSVKGGNSNGGNITIDHPQFVVLNQGQIKAQADEGHGGNIHIVAQQFLKTPDSLVSASSRVGLDGQVIIDSPAETISGSLLVLGTTFTDVSGLLPGFCTELSFEEFIHRSRFLVNPIAGSPPRPDDLKPSSLLLPIPASPNFTKATMSNEKKVELTQRLAWLTGCHR